MKLSSNHKHKRNPWILILLMLALLLLISWLLIVVFWSSLFPDSSEKLEETRSPIQKMKDSSSEILRDWGVLSEDDKDSIEDSPKGTKEQNLSDGHGQIPSMKELLTEQPFEQEVFDQRFESMKKPIVSQQELPHSTFGKKVAYVYHSHNRESFLPYFPETDNPKDAYDGSRNITKVGEMLERALENRGVGTLVDTTDIIRELDQKGLDFTSSYQISGEHLQSARVTNRDLTLFFDIHRDSLRKKATTTKIDGQPFAQLFFVVGTAHDSFERNLAYTEKLHQQLNNAHPGLSKGIYQKDSTQGNGVYNQNASPKAVLIELGGVDSTLEEMSRTTEALADAVSELYWHEEE